MKKASYDYIRQEYFNARIENKLPDALYFHVEELPPCVLGKGVHIITSYYNGKYYTIAAGKELKGYKGDIIRVTYDGYVYGTGDYHVTSDRHGLICKIKQTNLAEKLADVLEERRRKQKFNALFYQKYGYDSTLADLDIAHLELVEIGLRETLS